MLPELTGLECTHARAWLKESHPAGWANGSVEEEAEAPGPCPGKGSEPHPVTPGKAELFQSAAESWGPVRLCLEC